MTILHFVVYDQWVTDVLLCTGTTVAQILATDADKDENATLVYDFKKGKT